MTAQQDINDISRRLSSFSNTPISSVELLASALKIKNNIFVRTASGVNFKGQNFKQYSQKYAKKEGKRQGLVNLQQTGKMLGSMTQKVIAKNTAMIFFNNAESARLADIHTNQGAGRSKVVRKFFLPNEDDEIDVYKIFQKSAQEELKANGF